MSLKSVVSFCCCAPNLCRWRSVFTSRLLTPPPFSKCGFSPYLHVKAVCRIPAFASTVQQAIHFVRSFFRSKHEQPKPPRHDFCPISLSLYPLPSFGCFSISFSFLSYVARQNCAMFSVTVRPFAPRGEIPLSTLLPSPPYLFAFLGIRPPFSRMS